MKQKGMRVSINPHFLARYLTRVLLGVVGFVPGHAVWAADAEVSSQVSRLLSQHVDNQERLTVVLRDAVAFYPSLKVRRGELDAGLIAGQAFNGHQLLHLAGGVDAVKGPFASIYVGTTPSEVNEFLLL